MKPSSGKSIPTKYNGITYRSRMEAKWAVFYDTLDIKYEYEAEGFDLSGKWYLPDFYLTEHDCFIEVKGPKPTQEDCEKASMLSEDSGKDVFLFYGEIPNPSSPWGVTGSKGAVAWGEEIRDRLGEEFYKPHEEGYYWTQCNKCVSFAITKGGRVEFLPCECFTRFYMDLWEYTSESLSADELHLIWYWLRYRYDSPLLRLAYNNARNADFRSGVAHGVTFWQREPGSYPFNDDVQEVFGVVQKSWEKHDPTLFADYMQNKPMNWRNVRWVNRILSMNNK